MCGSSTDFLAKAPYPLSKGRQVISGVHLQSVASSGPGCFFFVVAPFCSCPVSLVSRKFFAVGPGCAKVFFFVALRWAPRPFGAARAKKKNTTQGVFFFCSCPGERQGKEKPRAGTGPEQKKKHHPGCFFCCGPGERQGKEKPRWAPARGQSKKKKHHPGCFFFVAPAPGKDRGRRSPVGRRHGARAKKKTTWVVFVFLLWPRAGAQRGFAWLLLPLPFPGVGAKKKHPGWCFFFALAPCRRPSGLLLPLPFAGAAAKKTPWVVFFFLLWPRVGTGLLLPLPFAGAAAKKKKTPWVVFFFCCGPARTLTHSLRAWVAMPPPRRGGVFFLLRPRPDRAGVFFFCCGPARTLTHSLWAGAISARPGWCFFFFCCGPGGSF